MPTIVGILTLMSMKISGPVELSMIFFYNLETSDLNSVDPYQLASEEICCQITILAMLAR